VVSFTPQLLYPQRTSSWYPLDRRLGGPQSQSGCSGEGKKIPSSYQDSKPLIIQPVAQCYTTKLSWLLPFIYILLVNRSLKWRCGTILISDANKYWRRS
jgi:hypothetical protein